MGRSTKVSLQYSMNKLLLVALLGFVLIALSVGEEENNESSLQAVETEVEQIREVRDADPGKRKRKKSGAMKKRKKNKSRKRKKQSKKAAKKGKKKAGRKNRGKGKGKGKKKKSKGKKKKSKGRKRKNKGRKKKKSSKKVVDTRIHARSTCADEACLTALGKYMNQYNQKYRNFENQKNRITKFSKLTGNKGGKKDAFKTIKGQIRETGGGNASALSCGGKTSGTGQKLLKDIYDKLTACSAGIKKACETDKPAINQTFIDACSTKMTAFKTEADKCIKETDATKACTCWKSTALKTASDNIGTCDISKLNGEVAKFKKSCTAAFAECRQTEDKGSKLIQGCDSKFAANQLKNLNNANANSKALTSLKAAVEKKTTRRLQTRSALTCKVFATKVSGLITLATNAPLMPKIATDAAALEKSAPTAACDAAIKATLKALVTSIATIIADLATIVKDIQADLLDVTGTTASTAQISAAGTTATATTTKKASGRLVFKNMLV